MQSNLFLRSFMYYGVIDIEGAYPNVCWQYIIKSASCQVLWDTINEESYSGGEVLHIV